MLPLTPVLSASSATVGRIHSVETCGTVDGPGIRYVIFTQGCPLRCLYCHNPDCRSVEGGRQVTVSELVDEILPYRAYLDASRGGITVSGGEPLLQPEFVTALFQRCQAEGLHTALDTSGFAELAIAQSVVHHADLVLLDIKSFDPKIYQRVTHVSNEPTLQLAQYLSDMHRPVWIRFVLVPDLTDSIKNVEGLAQFVASLTNVERVEVLPFHQMGAYKWKQLGYSYRLQDTQPPSSEQIERVKQQFRYYGLTVQ